MHICRHGDGQARIELAEAFDFHAVPAFRRCYESLDCSGLKSLTIDFGRTRYIDSAAMGALLVLQTHLQPHRVPIMLTCLSEQLYRIFDIARFDKLFVIER